MTYHTKLRHTPQRSTGQITIAAKSFEANRSGLAELRQSGSGRVLMTSARDMVEGVILNTSGGITGGDRFSTVATAGANSHLRLTTQAAERIYRTSDLNAGQVHNSLSVAEGARLDWLPQETILYNRARLNRHLEIDSVASATSLIVEPLIFGRLAMNETLTQASFLDRITLRQDGQVIFQDATRLVGDIAAALDLPAIGNGARAMALVLFAAPNAEQHIDPVRSLLPATAGASLLQSNLLACRILAADGFALRQTLLPVLDYLTDNNLPRSWRL